MTEWPLLCKERLTSSGFLPPVPFPCCRVVPVASWDIIQPTLVCLAWSLTHLILVSFFKSCFSLEEKCLISVQAFEQRGPSALRKMPPRNYVVCLHSSGLHPGELWPLISSAVNLGVCFLSLSKGNMLLYNHVSVMHRGSCLQSTDPPTPKKCLGIYTALCWAMVKKK